MIIYEKKRSLVFIDRSLEYFQSTYGNDFIVIDKIEDLNQEDLDVVKCLTK